jgi:hypothetical protein
VGSRPQYFLAARTPIAVPFQKQFALVAPFVAITIIAAVLLPFSFVGKANIPARHIPRLLGGVFFLSLQQKEEDRILLQRNHEHRL